MPEKVSVDNLLFYDPDFEFYAEGFRKDHPAGIAHLVSNTTDII